MNSVRVHANNDGEMPLLFYFRSIFRLSCSGTVLNSPGPSLLFQMHFISGMEKSV
jgi:hypothetical protein